MSEFVEFKKDGIWLHFLREKHGQSAKCKVCKAVLKTTGGSTKGLHEHLKRVHDNSVLKRPVDDPANDNVIQSKPNAVGPMIKYVMDSNDRSLQAVISRMTARDGLPFSVFTTSPDLRKCLLALGYDHIPNSAEHIKQLVMNQGRKVRSFLTSELATRRQQGHRFSLTFDEWTSTRNRRYMVVNVHEQGPKYWCLGLIRVHGSMPADKCVSLLENKLAEFNINLENDIVGICTDGASVMTKVGKLISAEHQLCYAHGIQLAVVDVLYRQKTVAATTATTSSSSIESADDEEEDDDEDEGLEVTYGDYDELTELSHEYLDVVKKVRKVVKLFRRSPTKNDDTLQPYIKKELGKELSLILDCRTRWNSLADMLARFLILRGPVQKAMIDLSQQSELSDADFTVIQEMVSCLEPLKLTVYALSKRETNLISAEAALKFCIVQLQKQNSEMARNLAEILETRVKERRGLHSGMYRLQQNNNQN